MRILFGFLWGILTLAVMAATNKYWVPALHKKEMESASKEETGDDLGQALPQTVPGFHGRMYYIILAISTVFAFACGYFAASYLRTDTRWFAALWLAFSVLACITITDWQLFLIPNKCSVVLLVGGCLLLVWEWIAKGAFPVGYALESALSLIVSLVVLLLMSLVSRGGIGAGDVKIACTLAFVCGLRAVCYVLVIALVFSAISSAILLMTKKKQLKDLLPLGPFMWLAMGLLILMNFI